MKVGIPKALLYYKNEKFWTYFFDKLGVDYILSPDTNREIIKKGSELAVDETCLPLKILLGHIDWLKDKCDCIFVPRIVYCAKAGEVCTRFLAQIDLVKNTFRKDNLNVLFYNVANRKVKAERKAFVKMGKYLQFRKGEILGAYYEAKAAQRLFEEARTLKQEEVLNGTDKLKVLIVAHAYNIEDRSVGEPVLKQLRELGCEPVIAEFANAYKCIKISENFSSTLPWAYNKHLAGAIVLYKEKIDGIVILTTFPCGPDSMVNDMIVRKIKDKPILNIIVDSQSGMAGVETRLESFVDILNFSKERKNGG